MQGNTQVRRRGSGTVTTRATVYNQRGELVLDGEHQYSLRTLSGAEK
jgi:acyl dehydratase